MSELVNLVAWLRALRAPRIFSLGKKEASRPKGRDATRFANSLIH
jgi:hypothetical protein